MESNDKYLKGDMIECLKILPKRFINSNNFHKLLKLIEGMVGDCDSRVNESIDMLCENFKFEKSELRRIYEASKINSETFESAVHEKAREISKMLLRDQSKDGSWKYLCNEAGEKYSNSRITATCIYSLYRIGKFLQKDDEFTGAIRNGINWLFNKQVIIKSGEQHGWGKCRTARNFKEDIIVPNLFETSYVFNILIKVDPLSKFDYEMILFTIIQRLGEQFKYRMSIFKKVKENIATYSLVLQCLSNYIRNCKLRERIGKVHENLFEPTLNLRNFLCVLISKVQNKNGSWSSNSQISNQLATAHAINGLRSAGVSRSRQSIVSGCNWLLKQLTYQDGRWCWTKYNKKEGKYTASVFETCVCIAAILKGTTFKSFSRAEAAILWLLNEVSEKNNINNENFPNILCAFAYYLRALSTPGFYKQENQTPGFYEQEKQKATYIKHSYLEKKKKSSLV